MGRLSPRRVYRRRPGELPGIPPKGSCSLQSRFGGGGGVFSTLVAFGGSDGNLRPGVSISPWAARCTGGLPRLETDEQGLQGPVLFFPWPLSGRRLTGGGPPHLARRPFPLIIAALQLSCGKVA